MDKTVPTGAAMLLDFIGGIEAPRGYDTIFGNRQSKLAKPITAMTLAELQAAQKNWGSKSWVARQWGYKTASSASGRYQFMYATLRDLIAELGLSPSQKLDANLQDRLGYHLLKRRGYEAFAKGRMDSVEFGKRLAMEWASLPVLADTQGAHRKVKRGQSYYAGDGLNKQLVTPEKVEAVLALVKDAIRTPKPGAEPVPAPKPSSAPVEPGAQPAPAPPTAGKVIVVVPSEPKPHSRNWLLAALIDFICWLTGYERKE